MASRSVSNDALCDFLELGYLYLPFAFDPIVANSCRMELWSELNKAGIYKDDANTWVKKYTIDKIFEFTAEPWRSGFSFCHVFTALQFLRL